MKNIRRHGIKKIRALPFFLLKYIRLQLFITVCAFPLLASWGIPLSYAALVGNLIFTPFISAFLLVSSLIFLTELLFIPNSFLLAILELIASCWLSLLQYGSRSWLFGCRTPHAFFLLLIPIIACVVVQYKKLLSPIKNTFALFLLLITCCLSCKFLALTQEGSTTITCFEKDLQLVQVGTHGLLIDPGVLGRRVSASSWVQYTLIPKLTRQGITKLTIICARPSAMTFQAVGTLIDQVEVDRLYFPAWTGSLKNKGWSSFEKLLTLSKKYGTTIKHITTACTLKIGTRHIEINPENSVINKNKIKYHALVIKY